MRFGLFKYYPQAITHEQKLPINAFVYPDNSVNIWNKDNELFLRPDNEKEWLKENFIPLVRAEDKVVSANETTFVLFSTGKARKRKLG